MEHITKDNLAIIVVSYNPDENLYCLLDKCCEISKNIFLIDNASTNLDKEYLNKKYPNINLILLNVNSGIGKAINTAIKEIKINTKISWFLTFDQDSLPPDNMISAFNDVISKEKKIGIVGLNYNRTTIKNSDNRVLYEDSFDLITSGSLHNINVVNIIGPYNEKLFIDCVDFEYNLRVKKNGYRTILIKNVQLNHTIGNPKKYNLGGIEITSMNHNPFRQYYIVRNHIWIAKEYFNIFPRYIFNKLYHLLIRLTKTMIVDDDKLIKIKRIYSGFKDGIKYRMNYD